MRLKLRHKILIVLSSVVLLPVLYIGLFMYMHEISAPANNNRYCNEFMEWIGGDPSSLAPNYYVKVCEVGGEYGSLVEGPSRARLRVFDASTNELVVERVWSVYLGAKELPVEYTSSSITYYTDNIDGVEVVTLPPSRWEKFKIRLSRWYWEYMI